MAEVLAPSFYDRPVVEVARDLVGCRLEHEGTAGIIVEAEAYHDSEPACHAYVYRSYGVHALLNAVCEGEDTGAAVLIRALEPVEGIEGMRARRGLVRLEDLCSGPGKLTQAMAIGLDRNATSLVSGPVRIGPRPVGSEAPRIVAGPRVGINRAMELPWRFCALGSRSVSHPWPPGLRASLAA